MAGKIQVNYKKARRLLKSTNSVCEFYSTYGVSRHTYMRWLKEDPKFKKMADELGSKKRAGRPCWTPDIDKIARLAAKGLNQGQIIACLGVSRTTFTEYKVQNPKIREAMETGKEKGVAKIKAVLYELAKKEKNLNAVLAYLKRHDHETEEMPTKIEVQVVYEDKSATGDLD